MSRGPHIKPEKRARIIAMRQDGAPYKVIAEEVGVAIGTISSVLRKAGMQRAQARPIRAWSAADDAICRDYAAGRHKLDVASAMLRCSRPTVLLRCDALGLPRRRRWPSQRSGPALPTPAEHGEQA